MKHLDDKLYNRFLKDYGKRDEYQKSKINEILAKGGLFSDYLIAVFMIISLVWDLINHKISLGTISLVVLAYFNLLYFTGKSEYRNVLDTEYTDKQSYQVAIKQLKHKFIWHTFYGCIVAFIAMLIFGSLVDGHAITDWRIVLLYLVAGIVLGIIVAFAMYYVYRKRIKFIKK